VSGINTVSPQVIKRPEPRMTKEALALLRPLTRRSWWRTEPKSCPRSLLVRGVLGAVLQDLGGLPQPLIALTNVGPQRSGLAQSLLDDLPDRG
jgi:hypothetical protein